jgi:hypothetical protein
MPDNKRASAQFVKRVLCKLIGAGGGRVADSGGGREVELQPWKAHRSALSRGPPLRVILAFCGGLVKWRTSVGWQPASTRPPLARLARDHGEREKEREWTHIKVVIASHLDGELLADPRPHLRPSLAIEPAAFLDLAHDPLALALLGQDPAETSVVRCAPEDERPEKEVAGEGARPKEEEGNLEAQQGEVH